MLHEKNVILKLTLGAFRAQKKDKEATRNLARDKGAERDRLSVSKRLLPENVFDAVYKHDRTAAQLFNSLTMPWLDGSEEEAEGPDAKACPIGRICRTSVFPEIMGQLNDAKAARGPLVEAGLREYGRLLDDPRTIEASLGELYNPKDYPSVAEVRKRFRFAVKVFPVPASDWRINMAAEEVDEIRRMASAQQAEAVRNAQLRLAEEIAEPLKRVLAMYRRSDGKVQIREATMANLQDMARRITKLNITEDPRFDAIRAQIESELCSTPITSLRESSGQRYHAARSANDILSRLDSLVGDISSEPLPLSGPDGTTPIAPSRSDERDSVPSRSGDEDSDALALAMALLN